MAFVDHWPWAVVDFCTHSLPKTNRQKSFAMIVDVVAGNDTLVAVGKGYCLSNDFHKYSGSWGPLEFLKAMDRVEAEEEYW